MCMETIQPVLVTREYNQKQLILIVDKKGTLGSELANKLQEEFMIVLLTRNEIEIKKNTVHIPYLDTFPAIPNNHYEYMFIFYSGEKQLLSLLPSMLRKAVAERAKLFFIAEIGSFDARQIKRLLEHPYQRFHLLL